MAKPQVQESVSRYVCGWCGAEFDRVHKAACLYAGEHVKRWQTRREESTV